MGITIDENLLSLKARKFLSDLKKGKKSVFLRNLIEDYVNNIPINNTELMHKEDNNINQDIQYIKEMLKKIDMELSSNSTEKLKQTNDPIIQKTKEIVKKTVNTTDNSEEYNNIDTEISKDNVNMSSGINDDVATKVLGSIKNFKF